MKQCRKIFSSYSDRFFIKKHYEAFLEVLERYMKENYDLLELQIMDV